MVADAARFDMRLATMADCSVVEAIVKAAYSHYIQRIGRPPGPMGDDYAALIKDACVYVLDKDFTALPSEGDSVSAVIGPWETVGLEQGIRGVLVLIPGPDSMLLDNVAVAPEAQGRGLGARMLAFAELAARDAGFQSIRLYTHELMTENIARYTRIGYVETHRGEENGLRRVYMTKILDIYGSL